jgi:nucleotide-binding universal stress UspA family protein
MSGQFKVFVGVDESEGSAHAVRWALEEARARHGELTAVMTWGYLDQRPLRGAPTFEQDYTAKSAETALRQYLDEAVGPEAAAQIKRRLVNDIPTRGLVEASEDADLFVVGSRRLTGLGEFVLGSVAHHVTKHARCPVVVVPFPRQAAA